MEGATPLKGSVYRAPLCAPVNARRCRTSGQKRGVAPSTISPSRAAPRRAVRGGDNARRRRTTLYRRGFGESVPNRVQCGFPGTDCTTTTRGLPSDSKEGTLLNYWKNIVPASEFWLTDNEW